MAIPIKIELKFRTDECTRLMESNVEKLTEKIQQDAIKFVRFVQDTVVKPHVPVKTGRLRNSIDIVVDRRYKSQIVIRCYAGRKHPVPYAWFVEEGADEHDIIPDEKYLLKFEGTNSLEGKTIFVNYVLHPGFGGYFMFNKGLIVIQTHLPTVLQKGIEGLSFKVGKQKRSTK